MKPIEQLNELGQSLWLDYIRRDLIESGELAGLISAGEIRGVTSNPTIFQKAIVESDQYTASIRPLAQAGWSTEEIFDVLAIEDIRAAADLFLALYEQTNGGDGYVSIEVNPELADNAEATISETRRLWKTVNRPNVMIKIPATKAGIPAIEQAISEGINVNVTLIFSLERYNEVMEAYLKGLESRLQCGEALGHIASVASFFVSRMDTAVDKLLNDIINQKGPKAERSASLLGKAAIANAKIAYAQFQAAFASERFALLHRHGARVQRPLWASTSTKNPDYPDTYYVDNLIGPHTVNTVPPQTLAAFRDHGHAELTIETDLSHLRACIEALQQLGISLTKVSDQLEREGVDKFIRSYRLLMESLNAKAGDLRRETSPLLDNLEAILANLKHDDVGRRLWLRDTSLWTADHKQAEEVSRRMGWLTLPETMRGRIGELEKFGQKIQASGIERVVWMGMGGSSMTANVLRRMLAEETGLDFIILDSTDPAMVRKVTRQASIESTFFITASKSGTTAEPLNLLEHFWALAKKKLGPHAGEHFAVVTDPATPLESMAHEREFLRVFSGPTDIGGRYSALSVFGLLPAALMGVDGIEMLTGAARMARACGPNVEPIRNPGLFLGAMLGAAAQQGRRMITLVLDPALSPLGDWIEQLIAESSGKDGKGLLPVVGEPPGSGTSYGAERMLVYLRNSGAYDQKLRGWERAGVPYVIQDVQLDAAGIGAEFFRWEIAITTACHLIGVNAFNQPDVQRTKDRTIALLNRYRRDGVLPESKAFWQGEGVTIWDAGRSTPLLDDPRLDEILDSMLPDEHETSLAFLLFLPMQSSTKRRFSRIRRMLRDDLGIVSTMGFGPRYLHSTGQIHKGGAEGIVCWIITADCKRDVAIEGQGLSFGVFERAQAIGDLKALQSLGRRAYGIFLDKPARLQCVTDAIQSAINRRSD